MHIARRFINITNVIVPVQSKVQRVGAFEFLTADLAASTGTTASYELSSAIEIEKRLVRCHALAPSCTASMNSAASESGPP